jgi:acetate kinase
MGMSPQSGLPQNNRVGDLDSAALPFVLRATGISLDEADRLMTKESGLKGLSGGLNDIRDIDAQAQQGNSKAKMALDVLVHSARHWIGSYYLQLNGLDAIAFTAGIGENQWSIRADICRNLDQLGIEVDPELNKQTRAKEGFINAKNSRVKIIVIPTNEELVVAREARRYLLNNQ